MIRIPVIALLADKDDYQLSHNLPEGLHLHEVSSTEEWVGQVISQSVCIGLVDWNAVDENYRSILPDMLQSLTDVYVIIIDKQNKIPVNSIEMQRIEVFSNGSLIQVLEKNYMKSVAEPIKESVVDSINPLFGELSQCLLQINKDSRFPKLQSLLSELDRLYLEAKPLLDGLHYMRNEYDRSVKLPFPVNEIVKFYMNRYQRLSNGRLVFTMESNLRDSDYFMGPYLSVANLLEQLFCYCLAHTEYGFIGIKLFYSSSNDLIIQFCDTGDEHPHSQSYRAGLEKSYELVAAYLIRQLGGSLNVIASELSGFDIELSIPGKLFQPGGESVPKKPGSTQTMKLSVSQDVDFTEHELQVNYRLLLKELFDVLMEPYTPELATEWRKILHKAWPSVAMMGEKGLTEKLKTLHNLLKKEPDSKVIQTYQERIITELNDFFYHQ